MASAFAPARRAGRGTLLNVLSVLSWLASGDAYSATKAALWSATNTQRLRFAPDGVHVAALHVGYVDTPMAASVQAEKNDPAVVVAAAYDGIEAGAFETLADDLSRQVKSRLAAPVEAQYPDARRDAGLADGWRTGP